MTHHRMLLPHPAIDHDVEHANLKLMKEEKKLTLSLNPKKARVFLPLTEPLPFEKPGAGVVLTFIARFVLIPGTVRCGQPLENLFRCVNF